MKNTSRLWLSATALYIVLTFYLSTLPADIPTYRIQWLRTDHLAHIIEYGILAWLCNKYFISSAYSLKSILHWVLIISICGIVGAINEMIQFLTPGRTPSIGDEIANIMGAVFTLMFTRILKHKSIN